MFIYLRKNLILAFLLGILSGLPLALTASTLTIMLREKGVDLTIIGAFAMVGLPYTLKFLWAPLLDNIKIMFLSKIFGRRKAQLLFISSLLILAIIALGLAAPHLSIKLVAMIATLVTILAASNDVIIDAMRIEILSDSDQAAGSSMSTTGYRIAMVISSAGALSIAHFVDWKTAYLSMALVMTILLALCIIFYREVHNFDINSKKEGFIKHLVEIFIQPLKDIFKRTKFLYVLIFIVFFKMSDALIMALTSPFLIDIGFNTLNIAFVIKTFGMGATIIGAFIGGYISHRIGLKKFLVVGLVLQMVSNLSYIILLYTGNNIMALFLVASIEYSCSGISTAALVAYISVLCNKKFTASQYALFSALAGFARTTVAGTSGLIVNALGWEVFFIITAVASAPAFLVIRKATQFK